MWFVDEERVLGQEVKVAKALRTIIDFVSGNDSLNARVQPWIGLVDWPVIKALLSPWPTALTDGILGSDKLIDSERLEQLLVALDSSEHSFFHKLKQRLDGYRKEVRRPLNGAREPLVSLSQVRKVAKLDAAAATELFNSSYFTIKEIRNGPKGPTFWVSNSEFEKLNQWFNETVSLKRTAEIIGCPLMTVRGLLRLGQLQAAFLTGKPRSPRFFRSNIDIFIKSIEVRLADDSSKEHSLIPLAKVAPAKANCKRWCSSWPMFISGILAGTVPIFRLNDKRGWEGIGVRINDVRKCIYAVD